MRGNRHIPPGVFSLHPLSFIFFVFLLYAMTISSVNRQWCPVLHKTPTETKELGKPGSTWANLVSGGMFVQGMYPEDVDSAIVPLAHFTMMGGDSDVHFKIGEFFARKFRDAPESAIAV